MAVSTGKITNTVTDPGVVFGIGNALLNFHAAGMAGLTFNFTSIVVCLLLRARAEWGRDKPPVTPPSTLAAILDHRGTSLEFAAIAQLGVAIAALCTTGFTVGAAIPFLFFGGNLLAALSSEPAFFEKLRDKVARVTGHTVATFLTTPEIWSASGLILAADTLIPTLMFAIGGGVAVFQAIKKTAELNTSTPYMILAAGNFLAAGINLPSRPFLAFITTLFGAAFVSICALRKYGGVAEALRALRS